MEGIALGHVLALAQEILASLRELNVLQYKEHKARGADSEGRNEAGNFHLKPSPLSLPERESKRQELLLEACARGWKSDCGPLFARGWASGQWQEMLCL